MNVKYFNASFVWMRKFHYLPSPFIFTVKIWGKMLYKVRFESIIDFKLYEWCKTVVMNDSQQGIIYLVCSVWWNQIIIAVKRVVTSRCECDLEMMIILCFATWLNLHFLKTFGWIPANFAPNNPLLSVKQRENRQKLDNRKVSVFRCERFDYSCAFTCLPAPLPTACTLDAQMFSQFCSFWTLEILHFRGVFKTHSAWKCNRT